MRQGIKGSLVITWWTRELAMPETTSCDRTPDSQPPCLSNQTFTLCLAIVPPAVAYLARRAHARWERSFMLMSAEPKTPQHPPGSLVLQPLLQPVGARDWNLNGKTEISNRMHIRNVGRRSEIGWLEICSLNDFCSLDPSLKKPVTSFLLRDL